MVDKRSRGGGATHPLPLQKHCTAHLSCLPLLPPLPPLGDGRRVSPVQALRWEQENNSARATSSTEFMSCSSTQGHCGTQTHRRGFSPTSHFGAAHTGRGAGGQLWQPDASPELSRRDRTVTSDRARPADPGCNLSGHLAATLSCTHNKLTT